jgi:heptose I phosphotransferase
MSRQNFVELSEDLFVDAEFLDAFRQAELTTIDAVFKFDAGANLGKDNLPKHRSRSQFDLNGKTLFLKRYHKPPILSQLKNWFSHLKRACTSDFDRLPAEQIAAAGISTPKTVAFGHRWNIFFEKQSFIITEKIPNAESLERKLPDFIYQPCTPENKKQKDKFINDLADFARKFHDTGFRHRDFYLAHIFMDDAGGFYLIDLQRAFKPVLTAGRFRLKDITQLYYSAPGKYFTRSDRLRFYLRYTRRSKLTWTDRLFIRRVKSKAWRIANHDIKHGRAVPFAM